MTSFMRKFNARQLLVTGLLFASVALSAAQTAPATHKKTLMWKAVNGANVVYLLGSIHIGSKSMYPLPKVIENAFDRSKVLVVEIDITNVDQPAMAAKVMKDGMYTGDDTLWNHVKPETAEKVKKFFTTYGLPEESAGKMKPWLVAAMASVLPFEKAGMDTTLGIDIHFLNKAKGHKQIVAAETLDFQLKLFESVPENLTDQYLTSSLGEVSNEQVNAHKIEAMWLSGDAETFDKAISGGSKELMGMERAMRENRNPHMADVAEKYLKGGGPCFFVVGAAHLIGDEGVVAILRRRGYAIFQVDAN